MPQQTIAPPPQLSGIPIPQDTQAPIAQGLSDLGQGLMQYHAHQDASLAAAQGASLAQVGDQMQVDLAKLQQDAGDAPDYLDRAQAIISNYRRQYDAGFGNNQRVRQQFEEATARTFAHADAQQQLWTIDRDAKVQATQADSALDTITNQVAGDPSDQRVDAANAQIDALIGGLHLPDADKARRQYRGQIAVAQVNGLMNASNFSGAAAKLDSGALDDVMAPEQLQVLRNQVRTRSAQARAQGVKLLDAQRADLAAGYADPAKWSQLATGYDAAGEPAKAIEARSQAQQISAALDAKSDTPIERQAKIDALATLPERSPAQEQALKGLQAQQGYVNGLSTLQRYTFATGASVAPLDWSEPQSIQQRAALVAAAQDKYGGAVDFLMPAEAAPIKQLIDSPRPNDRVQAAQAILAAGPYGGSVLDQVAPQDHAFRSAMLLAALPNGQSLMAKALSANDAIKGNADIFTPEKTGSGKSGPNFDAVMGATLHRAIEALPAAQRAAVIDNTRALYAATAGGQAWTKFHPGEAQRQLNVALGGVETTKGWAGGVGQWNGAATILPRGMLQSDFDQRLSRSTVQEWAAASVNGAPWVPSQNRTMSPRELRSLVPTMVRDGQYMLRAGDNSFITTRDGKPYVVDVRKLMGDAPLAQHGVTPPDASQPAVYLGAF